MKTALLLASVLALASIAGCADTKKRDDSAGNQHGGMDGHHEHAEAAHDHRTHMGEHVQTRNVTGDVLLSLAVPTRTINIGGSYAYPFTPDANTTGYVFELEWTPSTPLSEKLSLVARLHVDDQDPAILVAGAPEPLAEARGASPLRIAVEDDQFQPGTTYDVLVRADGEPVGVAVHQPFLLHVVAFHDVAFDPDHAMPDA